MSPTPFPSSPEAFFESWLPPKLQQLSLSSHPLAGSSGALAVTVDELRWWVSLKDGRLDVERTQREPQQADFQLLTDRTSFTKLVAQAAQLAPRAPQANQRARRLDAATLELVKNIPGSLQLRLDDQAANYWLSFGPGQRAIDPPACTLSCSFADYLELQAGRAAPMDLFMAGKIRVDGDAQIAMAIAGVIL